MNDTCSDKGIVVVNCHEVSLEIQLNSKIAIQNPVSLIRNNLTSTGHSRVKLLESQIIPASRRMYIVSFVFQKQKAAK